MKFYSIFSALLILAIALLNCTGKKSELIYFGKDSCSHCKMVIADKRFGSEIVTSKGKVYKFDSLECMSSYEKEQKDKLGSDFDEYLVDTTDNGNLIASDLAFILEDSQLRSPMGKGFLIGHKDTDLVQLMDGQKNLQVQRWTEVKKKLVE